MARFHSHSLTFFRQILCPLLLLIFMIVIHPTNGDLDERLHGIELVNAVCSQTSDSDFCVYILTPNPRLPNGWPTTGEIANIALTYAQSRAAGVRNLINSLPDDSSSSVVESHVCQILNEETIMDLSSADNNLNSHAIDAMVEDLNKAASATKNCQYIIQGKTSFEELASKNSDLITFCEISIAAAKFFP